MILKLVLVPSLLLVAGLALVALAMLAPPARERAIVPASERVRGLERLAMSRGAKHKLRRALRDPDPQVAAVAAILLRDLQRFPWRR